MKRASLSSPALALSALLTLAVIACGGSTSDPGIDAVTPGNAGGGATTAGAAGQGQAGQGQAGQGQAGHGQAGQGQAEGGNAGSGAGGSTGGQAGSAAGGQAGSGAGGSAGGSAGGAPYEPCAGKACGESCSGCDPKDPTCVMSDVLTYCTADGQCTPTKPACELQCKTAQDCPGGGGTCPSADCVNGQCVPIGVDCPAACAGKSCGDSCSTCSGPDCPPVVEVCNANGQCTTETPSCGMQCKTTNDCPLADCTPCPGGGTCPTADCVNGQCVYSGGGCDDPCLGKSCGESCSSCTGPGCPPVVEACDASGQCVPGKPVCGNQCATNQDCPQQPCELCPDGSQACSQTTCQQNQCVTTGATCPAPPPCSPQQISGEGSCKKLLGYAWDGQMCQAIDGCQCVGADCSALFASQSACEQANASCLGAACTTDQECPSPKSPCQICPDGVNASCPEGKCLGGHCQVVTSGCPASTPCAGKKCGDTCTTCTGNGCPPVVEYCDINGACSAQAPVCTFP